MNHDRQNNMQRLREHRPQKSAYEQFAQEYPALDAYGRKVASGGFLKENINKFDTALADARDSAFNGNTEKSGSNLMDYFGFGAITKAGKIKAKELGLDVTDDALDFPFMHNIDQNPYKKSQGMYGMDAEPAGQYLSHNPSMRNPGLENIISGKKSFKNPLFIEYGGAYDDASNWKRVLSKKYGKSGTELTEKLKEEGYDGIVTFDKRGQISEAVDLLKGKGGVDMGGSITPAFDDLMKQVEPDNLPNTLKKQSPLEVDQNYKPSAVDDVLDDVFTLDPRFRKK